MAKRPRRKCAHCRDWFHPAREGQTVCSFECASAIGKKNAAKARTAVKQKELKEQREAEKAGRQRRQAKRAELKTKSQWRSEAQAAFNRYVRLRDAGKPCISCDRLPAQKFGGTMDCGHYRTRGAASHLALNLHNKGYRATDSSGTLPIATVEIVADTVVKIIFARAATGTVKIWYADKTSHNGNGCLKDSDPFIATEKYVYTAGSGQYADENIPDLVDKPYSLNNWAWAQVITTTVTQEA